MTAGQAYQVSVTMNNTGDTIWTNAGGYKLSSQNPQDNWNWGVSRALVEAAESVAFGQAKKFTFTITAPSIQGIYNFQWRMVKEYVEWFGDYTPNAAVEVKPQLVSDLNQDGKVDSSDFIILKSSWNSVSKPKADINQDGIVNSVDLGIMMSSWNILETMKTKGCMFDGILWSAGGLEDEDSYFEMLDRSGCEYLPRAVETWNAPPDFSVIQSKMKKTTKSNLIWGMFIAESIKTDSVYYYPDENRNFNFQSMCREATLGKWGPNTCIPSFDKDEYRKYLRYTTRKAIDIGIKDFLFGQIYFLDPRWQSTPIAGEIVLEMKSYALIQGKQITVGAQTNDITGDYLKNFDYILGGTYHLNGNIENGPCLSTITSYCQALLWHPNYASSAKNVIIELDWYSLDDDIHRFAKMTREKRAQFLTEKYNFFTSQGIGFVMPFRVPLNFGSPEGNCYGYNEWVYSADNKYSCKDEDAINSVLLRTS